jgi:ribosomal protein L13E
LQSLTRIIVVPVRRVKPQFRRICGLRLARRSFSAGASAECKTEGVQLSQARERAVPVSLKRRADS